MNTWVVTLTYPDRLDQDALDDLGERLDHEDGSAYNTPDGLTITLWKKAAEPRHALYVALADADRIFDGDAIEYRVETAERYEARADAPTMPDLMSAPDVATLLDVSRQRVHQLRESEVFPEPLVELKTGPVWDRTAIEHFADGRDRSPGRPKVSH